MSVIDVQGKYYDSLRVAESQINDHEISIPLTATDSLANIKEEFTPVDIYFESNSSIVKDSFKIELDEIATYLKDNPYLSCSLFGYTDNLGLVGENGAYDYRSTAANKLLIERGYDVMKMYREGKTDPWTGKPVSKATYKAAKYMVIGFEIVEGKKAEAATRVQAKLDAEKFFSGDSDDVNEGWRRIFGGY